MRRLPKILLLASIGLATASCNALLGISDPEDEGVDASSDGGGDASDAGRDSNAGDTLDGSTDTRDADVVDASDANDTSAVTDSVVAETLPDVVDAADGACAPPTHYQTVVAADAPVDWWELEETSGAIAADRGTAPHDAAYTGAATLGQPGAVGCSLGVVMHGGLIEASGFPSLATRHSFSVELWVQPEASDGTPRYLIGRVDAGGGWYLQHSSVGVSFVMTGSAGTQAAIGGPLRTDAPNHVVAVYDASVDAMLVYVNDILSSPVTGTPLLPDATTDVSIANPSGIGMLGTTGLFDEIAIYDAALPFGKIDAHYGAR